jgi:hypothetical protein
MYQTLKNEIIASPYAKTSWMVYTRWFTRNNEPDGIENATRNSSGEKPGHLPLRCPAFCCNVLWVAFSIASGSLFLVNHPVYFEFLRKNRQISGIHFNVGMSSYILQYVYNFKNIYTKGNVTFYLPRPLHFLSYQSNRLLRRSDLHRKIILTFELS